MAIEAGAEAVTRNVTAGDLLLKVQVTFCCYWQMTQFMDRIPVNGGEKRFGFFERG